MERKVRGLSFLKGGMGASFLHLYHRMKKIRSLEKELVESRQILREWEEKYRNLVERANIGIVIIQDTLIHYANPALAELLGYSVEELAGRPFYDFVHPREREKLLRRYRRRMAGQPVEQIYETVLVGRNRKSIDVEVSAGRIHFRGRPADFVFIRDITQRKKAERLLRESEQKYRLLAENAEDGIYILGLQGFEYVNPGFEKIFGYSASELYSRSFDYLFLVHPEDRSRVKKWKVQREKGYRKPAKYAFRAISKDGRTKFVEVQSVVLPGQKLRILGIVRDLTERRKMEEALEEEKNRLQATISSIADAVIATDLQGRVKLMNRVAEEMTGWTFREASGRKFSELIELLDEHSRTCLPDPVEQVLENGGRTGMEGLLVNRHGREMLVSLRAASISDREGRSSGAVLVLRDITEQRRREEELYRAQKLESLGVLAGGIAHDFNNILTTVLGNISLARFSLDEPEKVAEFLEEAEKAALQARNLTQQLLTFSRGGMPVRELIALEEVIKEAAGFATRGSGVKCLFRISRKLWGVEADRGQIAQVIQNIVLNAVQAMPEGGTVTVKATNHRVAEGKPGLPPGSYVKISIRDTGVGIPEENLSRIFDPYFTTKETGCGLGLSIAYSIVKRHGGKIEVESKPGRGSTFHIYLPATGRKVPKREKEEGRLRKGSGRILLMDDEKTIREVARRMLQHLGYQVEVAADGKEAINKFRRAKKEGRPFDLVIMDLTVVGGMGGKEAARRILKIDPKAKLVVSSGYSNDPILSSHREYGFCGALRKPYKLEDLSRLLNRLLS